MISVVRRIFQRIGKLHAKCNQNFRHGFFKKQVSPFLHDVEIGDYVPLCGRYIFDNENMHVNIHFFNYKNIITKTLIIVMMVSTAFKLGNYKVPYIIYIKNSNLV